MWAAPMRRGAPTIPGSEGVRTDEARRADRSVSGDACGGSGYSLKESLRARELRTQEEA